VCDVNPCCVFVDVCFVLYLFQKFVCLHVCAYNLKLKIHCGSVFESGASNLPFKPFVYVPNWRLCGDETTKKWKPRWHWRKIQPNQIEGLWQNFSETNMISSKSSHPLPGPFSEIQCDKFRSQNAPLSWITVRDRDHPRDCVAEWRLRVEFLLKTDSGYPRWCQQNQTKEVESRSTSSERTNQRVVKEINQTQEKSILTNQWGNQKRSRHVIKVVCSEDVSDGDLVFNYSHPRVK